MSDPLSVAGSAVGIVSLGIQVCQGLVWYFNSVQARRQDIEGGLGEVQTLASIFYSLNDLLPKINQARRTEATMIQQCLRNSEEMLLELHQSLIRLRGLRPSTTNGEKMREKGRMLLYPFQAGKLEALRESLRGLLGNLNLAVNTTSLGLQAMNEDKVEAIDKAMQDLAVQSKDTNAGVQDLNSKMQENRDRLRSLESTITNLLTQVSHRVSKVEVAVKDLEGNITGELTVLGNGVTSIHQGLTGVAGMLSSQSAVISQLRMELSRTQDQGALLSNGPLRPATRHESKNNSSSHLIPPMCNCKRESRPSGFSFAFWNLQFEFKQNRPGQHHRSCKFFGIDGQTQRHIKAQFPLKLAWLSARMTLACAEFTTGTNTPGYSIRYRNVVPGRYSPVRKVLLDTAYGILASRSASKTVQLLEGTEREILSLYKDRRASPNDRDEHDCSHTEMFINTFARSHHQWLLKSGWDHTNTTELHDQIWHHNSVLAAVLRTLQTLDALVRVDDIRIEMDSNPFFKQGGTVDAKARITRSQGYQLVSYLATTQTFNPGALIRWCLVHGTFAIFQYLPDIMAVMGFSPMTRAIVVRSLDEVKKCFSVNPEAATETVYEFNVLHLCSSWPEGLRFFLRTEALSLIDCDIGDGKDLSPLSLAISARCTESQNILMREGCRFDPHIAEWWGMSPQCAQVAGYWLFERRVELFQLAQDELQDFEDEYTYDTTEIEASCVYENLLDEGISVPPALEVEDPFTTIYHSPWVPFDYFPILFEAGFRNHSADLKHGLTPVMTWRLPAVGASGAEYYLPWLREEGFLDQTPEDPYDLGLNVTSTGWHHLAAMSCFHSDSEVAWAHFPEISQSSARDNCVCWCIPGGKGCSPVASILKAYADSDRDDDEYGFWARGLVDILCSTSYDDGISANMGHFVRLLTFEALEMTHTCCHFGVLDHETLEFITDDDTRQCYQFIPWDGVLVILDQKEDMIQETRTDETEEANAALLHSLMEEFNKELHGIGPSPEALKSFLNGYWRRRMAQLFRVHEENVNGMKGLLVDVKTYELPERAQRLLGPGFILRAEDCAVGTGSRCHTESDVESDLLDENCSESEVEDESELGNDGE